MFKNTYFYLKIVSSVYTPSPFIPYPKNQVFKAKKNLIFKYEF